MLAETLHYVALKPSALPYAPSRRQVLTNELGKSLQSCVRQWSSRVMALS